jgi:hypothetical protein
MSASSRLLQFRRRPHRVPLRIALFSHGLPRAGEHYCDFKRAAHFLADGLVRRGHSVTVVGFDSAPEGTLYDVVKLPGEPLFRSWLGEQLALGYSGSPARLHAAFRGADLILTHCNPLGLPLGKPLFQVFRGGERMERLRAASCVDRRLFRPGERKTAFPSILWVGELGGRQRGRKLVDWFRKTIRPRHSAAQLWMVSGQGPFVPGVSYFPAASEAELVGLYQRAWIFASPSLHEGFGSSYLEAMACGTPVVASYNPRSREILADGRYGCLATDSAWPDTLLRLLSDPHDRRKLQEAGLHRAEELSLERTLDRYERLFAGLVEKKRAKRAGSSAPQVIDLSSRLTRR